MTSEVISFFAWCVPARLYSTHAGNSARYEYAKLV